MQSENSTNNNFRKILIGLGVVVFVSFYLIFKKPQKPHPPRPQNIEGLSRLLSEIEEKFTVDGEFVKENIIKEMREGLKKDSKSSLKMIPTYVTKLPSGKESGTACALDIGGSNLRVLKVDMDGKGNAIPDPNNTYKAEISKEYREGSGDQLFEFISDCVSKVVQESTNLGYTFSFPVDQKNISSGFLIEWTKDFTATGVVNNDVVRLLNEALKRRDMDVKVNALINDTTGTLLAGAYKNVGKYCPIGLILGTGSNTCYVEEIEKIEKLDKSELPKDTKYMVVNMESGNFGARTDRNYLPMTEWDRILDNNSKNEGNQLLEKQIAGMYLGELTRIIIFQLIENQQLFSNSNIKRRSRSQEPEFKTEYMSEIEGDESTHLDVVKRILGKFGINDPYPEELKFVKDLVHIIANRAALLAAALIAACITHIEIDKDVVVVVAVDGSVFEKYPKFPDMISYYLDNLLENKVELVLAKDGSGVGAAIASLMESQ